MKNMHTTVNFLYIFYGLINITPVFTPVPHIFKQYRIYTKNIYLLKQRWFTLIHKLQIFANRVNVFYVMFKLHDWCTAAQNHKCMNVIILDYRVQIKYKPVQLTTVPGGCYRVHEYEVCKESL